MADDGRTASQGTCYGENGKFVDQLCHFFPLNDSAFEHRTCDFHDAARLQLIHVLDRFAYLRTHADQNTQHRGAGRI